MKRRGGISLIIETERLQLIPLNLHQMELWTENLTALESELNCIYQAEPVEGIFYDIIKKQTKLTEENPKNSIWHNFWFLIRKNDRVVLGSADFKNGPTTEGEAEIGYGLGPQYEHHGYMTEAIHAMCQWALKQEGVSAVIAETDLDNAASQRVLERCGFHETKRDRGIWWRLGRK
jgi:RimJ/RimL family protein N-acetyltransferase